MLFWSSRIGYVCKDFCKSISRFKLLVFHNFDICPVALFFYFILIFLICDISDHFIILIQGVLNKEEM